ncbi:3-beta-hydroxysteroid-Delta(8),Delta(7)-isomerase [Trichoplax sp. H2]|nr:3-beta-hydroxysteroid-Delta(8),Delta(7)-isomerase [Trichoplax sp. H2]|eukprot:RDD46030.1 3-beta-hydroxysteroid-Delta(8),Delta(7)-isomerase [Trichoplax sp. H2]
MAEANPSHPYHPKDLVIPHYKPNDITALDILTVMFSGFGVVFVGALLISSGARRRLSFLDKLSFSWFVLCGFIHMIIEGYFSLYHQTLANHDFFLGQLWKEYSLSDSRYLISDNFTLCMETITAFVEGPACFLLAYAVMTNKSYRNVLQLCISLGQLYGDVLYFATGYRDEHKYTSDSHPIYFYFYYLFLNMLWIVIPTIHIIVSFYRLSNAQACVDSKKVTKKTN